MCDEKEFTNNYQQNRSYVYHLIGRYISDACTIEDLTQHTFMKAWIARHTFRGDSAYRTWLHKIAVNTALNHIIAQRSRPAKYSFALDENCHRSIDDVVQNNITYQEVETIRVAILKLPLRLADLITLNIIYGLTYEEIAQVYQIPIGTVRSSLHRARYLLKDLLR